jgi:hypothetical protein
MVDRIKNKFFPSRKKNLLYEGQALQMIRPVLNKFNKPIILTESSLQPSALLTIQNDIILNDRKLIVETGSGVGTLFIAMICKVYGLDLKLFSIEEDLDWIALLKKSLEEEGLEGYVEFIYAPVGAESESKWYDEEVVNRVLDKSVGKIDSLIIDGPKAYKKGYENARLRIVDVLGTKLGDNCFVLVDDVHRKGERGQVKYWEEKFGFKFKSWYNTFSVATKGDHYNYKPL